MKIVLAEEQNGSQLSEKSFSQGTVRIGRDPLDCQITFDNAKYPMVSRKHAELRHENGNWILHDLNSSFGTYVDGQKRKRRKYHALGQTLMASRTACRSAERFCDHDARNFAFRSGQGR